MYDATQSEEGSQGAPAEEELPPEMMEAFGISFITKIGGDEIISHNADRVEGGIAIWETPTLIEVTLLGGPFRAVDHREHLHAGVVDIAARQAEDQSGEASGKSGSS